MSKRISVLLVIFLTLTINGFSETVESLVEKGDTYRENFQNVQAAEAYKKAFDINSDNFEIMKNLILSYNDSGEDHREKDSVKAEEYFKKAIEYAEISRQRFPERVDNYFLLALTYGNMARFTDGRSKVELARNVEENIKKIIEAKPEFAPSYVVLGVYYREVSELGWLAEQFADKLMGGLPEGSLEESREALEKAVSLNPVVIYAQYELAKTYESLELYEKALNHYKKVIDLPVTDHLDELKKGKARKAVLRVESKLKNRYADSFK